MTKEKPVSMKTRTCAWPNGTPGEKDFHFCGKMAVPGKPYCQQHVGKAFIRSGSRLTKSVSSKG